MHPVGRFEASYPVRINSRVRQRGVDKIEREAEHTARSTDQLTGPCGTTLLPENKYITVPGVRTSVLLRSFFEARARTISNVRRSDAGRRLHPLRSSQPASIFLRQGTRDQRQPLAPAHRIFGQDLRSGAFSFPCILGPRLVPAQKHTGNGPVDPSPVCLARFCRDSGLYRFTAAARRQPAIPWGPSPR